MKRILLVALFWLLCYPLNLSAQDSTAVQDLNEEKELKFQQYFFKALSEKSIKNYQKAIENLEFCNELIPKNPAVLFEFSKNYFLLNQLEPAKNYIRRALSEEPNNLWMLTHLSEIHKKERDYTSAIEVLKKIVIQNPSSKQDLVRVYYLNRDYKNAMTLIEELEKNKGLSRNLRALKQSLEYRKGPSIKQDQNDLTSLLKQFEQSSSFDALQKILDKARKEDLKLFHEYSKKALDLFPAQPYSYLKAAESFRLQNKLQDALNYLESGIDFVIDSPKLEAQFYEELAKVHDALGNVSKAQEFRNKAKKLNALK